MLLLTYLIFFTVVNGERFVFSPRDISIRNFNTYEETRTITYKFETEGLNEELIKDVKDSLKEKYHERLQSIHFSIPDSNNIVTITTCE